MFRDTQADPICKYSSATIPGRGGGQMGTARLGSLWLQQSNSSHQSPDLSLLHTLL